MSVPKENLVIGSDMFLFGNDMLLSVTVMACFCVEAAGLSKLA